MKTKFMGVAAALTAALALVFGVAVPGALPSLPAPTAQAQTTAIPVSPQKQDFKNTATTNTYSFTVDADATMNSFDFTVTGNYFLLEYALLHNGTRLKSETFSSSQKLPLSRTASGLNTTLKKGDKLDLYLRFNQPREQGSVSVTPKGTLGGDTTPPPTEPEPEPEPSPEPEPENPKPPAVEGRHFDAIGHEFAVKADPVDPKKPNAFTAKVTEESHMKYATVRIETDATFLDPQKYNLTLDQIEPGVTLQKRNVKIGNGVITMDVVPVKDGKPVDSAVVPKDAVFTFTNNLSENKNLKVTLDVYGEKKSEPKPPPIISPPDGAQWVNGRVPNPPMPQRCGLRIAVVADLSTSLNYADSNGFTESKKAANALIDSLAGTPAELGIYNFAGGAPRNPDGSTYGQNPPYISLQSDDGVRRAKSIVSNWNGNGSTNWEAGLKQVAAGDYDVVYFITDGMPTYSSKSTELGLGGEFVQESALNQAIDAANELKAAGTRVVPIMVDLTVGGTHAQHTTVTQDLVLKNVRYWERGTSISKPGLYWQFTNKYVDAASYVGSNTTANFEIAYKNGGVKVWKRTPQGRNIEVTRDQSEWTYGPRGVKTMGEDISGEGDTIRVGQYSQLAAQMKQIGEELASRCNGVVKVKKRIVDANGKVLEDGAPGWEFSLSAGGQDIIDPGNGELVRKSLKATSSAENDRGTASWNIKSEEKQELTLVETQQPGFNLYKRNGKNAVCTETRDGVTKPIEVENDGEFGFKVTMHEKDKKLSSVSCVVDNYKQPETPPGKLTFKKAQYVDGEIVEMPGLGGATFEVYPSKGGQPDYSAGALYTIKPGQDSIEVKTTGTFFLVETKAPKGLNLLAQPVQFQISVDEQTKKYKISAVSTSSGQIQVSGQGDKMILQVADTTAGKLPKTGGYGVGLLGLIGVALAGAGLLLGRRKTA